MGIEEGDKYLKTQNYKQGLHTIKFIGIYTYILAITKQSHALVLKQPIKFFITLTSALSGVFKKPKAMKPMQNW